jgi:succinate-semialdehyde dehydrogenase/glutarate-semialdehyde dehydrogenase
LGFALDYSTDIGSLSSERQLTRVSDHVQSAIAAGAKVVTGGQPRLDLGPFFFEPTILAEVTPEAPLCREETFGPVVSVYPLPVRGRCDQPGQRNRIRFKRCSFQPRYPSRS